MKEKRKRKQFSFSRAKNTAIQEIFVRMKGRIQLSSVSRFESDLNDDGWKTVLSRTLMRDPPLRGSLVSFPFQRPTDPNHHDGPSEDGMNY